MNLPKQKTNARCKMFEIKREKKLEGLLNEIMNHNKKMYYRKFGVREINKEMKRVSSYDNNIRYII